MSLPEQEPQYILIVDAIPANLALLEESLNQKAVQIIKANSGKDAISALEQYSVSLILMDAALPEIDGYITAETIHHNTATQHIPIIFISESDHSTESLFRSYQSGAVDVLKRPLQPEILRSKVRIFLELDEQRRQIRRQSQRLEHAFEQLQHYAQHDQLTGLFNREEISSILVQLMARAKRHNHLFAMLFLDLDHFKHINDSLGHDVGDMLLQCVADCLKQAVRASDFVARLGGDEFAIILSELDSPESAGLVAQKILEHLVTPQSLDRHEVLISCSIGIALYDDSYETAADLLKSADAAMYQAKRKGRSQFAYFSPELEAQALKRMEIARKLNEAIDHNELSVFYQPQIDAQSGQLVGFEALMRWQTEGEWISPALFIPIAEETGLIPKLGEWILLNSCLQIKAWQEEHLLSTNVKVAVNISNRQLQAQNFMEILQNVLKTSQLSPHCLELELTETTVMDDPGSTVSIFKQIHQIGVEIAVDDFGTGYSSLNYLRQLPLDRLKIDRSFVQDISLDRNDEAIIKAIIGLSHNLGLKVVAEGVETRTQCDFLKNNHCDLLQGFLFSRPIPATEIPEFVQRAS